ncbi:MAG: carboxypeptidase-like regulatory domain-containing protein [Pirellulaceae bacterium]
MRIIRDGGCGVLVMALGLVLGCGEGTGVSTVAVTGTVTHKGAPLAGAVVSFVPVGGVTEEKRSAVGVTDAAGKYSLTTQAKDDGAVPGEYQVSITRYEGPPPVAGGGEEAGPDGEMPASYGGEAPETPPAQNLLPAKYASPDTSGLTATVAGGEPAPHDFDLEG